MVPNASYYPEVEQVFCAEGVENSNHMPLTLSDLTVHACHFRFQGQHLRYAFAHLYGSPILRASVSRAPFSFFKRHGQGHAQRVDGGK